MVVNGRRGEAEGAIQVEYCNPGLLWLVASLIVSRTAGPASPDSQSRRPAVAPNAWAAALKFPNSTWSESCPRNPRTS